MHDWQSLSHVRWECKYHVVIIPKYRRKVFYGRLSRMTGLHLWATGYCVSTVGLDEDRVRQYIREQEERDRRQGELDLE